MSDVQILTDNFNKLKISQINELTGRYIQLPAPIGSIQL